MVHRLLFPAGCALLIVAVACGTAAAGDGTEVVIARGAGDTADAAKKDALTWAMEKVVGMYVEGETLVDKDKVIRDRVLTFTGGEISSSKVLKETKRGGRVEVWMRVEVRADTLKQRLRANNVTADERRAEAIRRAFAGLEPRIDKASIAELIREYHPASVWKASSIGWPLTRRSGRSSTVA
jgi:hypothetical protein